MQQQIERSIIIKVHPAAVWNALTNPDLVKQWMADSEVGIELITNWQIGSSITIKGFHHVKFENRGTVLQFEPDKILQYNYLSSLSRLPDKPENYSIIEFKLVSFENQTALKLTVSNFPTETIFKHVDFYWRTAIEVLRKFIENQ